MCRYMSIIFDAMDQQKCSIPHFHLNAKSWKEQTNKVHMQYGAFLVHGHGARSFVVDSRLKKDADLWMSGLLAVLKELKEEYAAKRMSWPSTLYLQADNASDNKNLLVYTVCQMLRDMGIFKKVKFKYMKVLIFIHYVFCIYYKFSGRPPIFRWAALNTYSLYNLSGRPPIYSRVYKKALFN